MKHMFCDQLNSSSLIYYTYTLNGLDPFLRGRRLCTFIISHTPNLF